MGLGKGRGKGRGWGRGGDDSEPVMCCAGCCAMILFILVPMCFSGCEYYEVCLSKSSMSSTVNTKDIYQAGNHFIGPFHSLLPYPMSAQNMKFEDLSVWSKASKDANGKVVDAGVALYLDVSLQYQLKKDKIGELYTDVALNYEGPIRNYATEALKQTATQWSADDYLKNRRLVEADMKEKAAAAIDKGHATIVDLQLRAVTFTAVGMDSFVQSKLRAAIQNEKNDQEEFKQKASLIRSETKTQKELKQNEASQKRQHAKARATVIAAQSKNQAGKLVELARNQGLNNLYTELKLNEPAQKASLDYLLTLSSSEGDNSMFVDFSQANAFQ